MSPGKLAYRPGEMHGTGPCGGRKAGFKRERSALAPPTPRSEHTAFLPGHSFNFRRNDVTELKRKWGHRKQWNTETSLGQD